MLLCASLSAIVVLVSRPSSSWYLVDCVIIQLYFIATRKNSLKVISTQIKHPLVEESEKVTQELGALSTNMNNSQIHIP